MKSSFSAQKAQRQSVFLKIGISGGAGSGKTMSALKLARGLCNDYSEIVVIDTENGSANLYSHLGDYSVIPFSPPHSPQRYIEAINYALSLKPKVIILDSVSHEWDGKGGCLEMKDAIGGTNDFTAWGKITPKHNDFIQAILQAPVHIVTTARKKQDYILEPNDKGKLVPKKVGLKTVQRDGYDYEITIDLELDYRHLAVANKDRTGLFSSEIPFTIDESTGEKIRQWNSGSAPAPFYQPHNNRQQVNGSQVNGHNDSIPSELLEKKKSLLQQIKNNDIPSHIYSHLVPVLKEHEQKGDWKMYGKTLYHLEKEIAVPVGQNGSSNLSALDIFA